jgi:hypothetical protein
MSCFVRNARLGAMCLALGLPSVGWSQGVTAPVVTFTTTKSEIAAGKTARISWTSTNAEKCVGTGAWSQTYEGKAAARGSFTTAVLTERSNTFVLTCTGPGGADTKSLTILALPKPAVTLTANPDRTLPGGSVALSWQSTDATSCSASGSPFSGTKPASGSETLTGLTKGTKKFSLSCKGVGGTTKVTTEVAVVPVPTLTFSASKTQIAENTATQLRWKASDATTCIASGDWSGEQKLSGSYPTGNLTEDQTYTLSCEGPNGEVEQTVTVEVVAAPQVSLTLDQELIAPGENVTIRWDVEDAQSCKASGSPFTGDKNITGGSETLEKLAKGTKTFKLTCKGGGGTTTAEATLNVIAKPVLSFSASKTQIKEGTATSLKWKATDATSCQAFGDWSGEQKTSGSFPTGNLSADKVYTLICTGPNGEDEKTVTVEVVPAPVVTLELSDTLVEPGTPVTVSWESEYATSCTAGGTGWKGTKAASGTETLTFADPGKRGFTLRCTGAGGTTNATPVELAVFPRPQIVSFEAKPSLLQIGQRTTLSWSTLNAKTCTASGDWSDSIRPSGIWQSAALNKRTNTFVLTCTGDGGEVSRSVEVGVIGDLAYLEFSSKLLVFEDYGVDTGSQSKEIIVRNEGSEKATFGRIAVVGNSPGGEFSVDSKCGVELAPGAQCTLITMFNASKAGRYEASIEVEISSATFRLPLTGLAEGYRLVSSPSSLTFQAVPLGQESKSFALEVKNQGRGRFALGELFVSDSFSNEFPITSDCRESLSFNEACQIFVRFKPKSLGRKTGVLTVKDRAGVTSLAVNLFGGRENAVPVAKINGPSSGDVDATVRIDGSSSYDPDEDPITYRWRLITRPVGSLAMLSAQSVNQVQLRLDRAGLYILGLIVNDGVTDSLETRFEIQADPINRAPIASAGISRSVDVGKEVLLDGSGSKDPDGKPLQYNWRFVSKPGASKAVLSAEKAPLTRFNADSLGSYFIELEVSDGEKSAKETVEILASEGTFAIRRSVGWSRLDEPEGLIFTKSALVGCPSPSAVDKGPDGRIIGVVDLRSNPDAAEPRAALYEFKIADGSCRKIASLPKVMTAIAIRSDGKILTVSAEGAFRRRTVHILDERGEELSAVLIRVKTPGGFFDPEEEVHRVRGIDIGPDQKLYSVNFASIWTLDPVTGESTYYSDYSGAVDDIDIDKFGILRGVSFGKLAIFDLNSRTMRAEYRLEWDEFAFSPLVRL